MIKFPPEFYGMVSAFWNSYQYSIWIWMALMFSMVVIIGIGIVGWSIIRQIVS